MKTFTFLLAFVCFPICVLVSCPVAAGAEWYVDDSVSSSGDGISWETAFKQLQEGIEAASDSDTVIACLLATAAPPQLTPPPHTGFIPPFEYEQAYSILPRKGINSIKRRIGPYHHKATRYQQQGYDAKN